jgi:hypothetical protein
VGQPDELERAAAPLPSLPAESKPAQTIARSVKVELPPETSGPAHRGTGDSRISKIRMTGFENIIDSVFAFDPDAVYKEVMSCLTLGQAASRTEYGHLVDALDESEENARKALQLVANAKVALKVYTGDVEIIRSELHEQATREVMNEWETPEDPKKPLFLKKPTIADIEAYKVSTYHDEWADGEKRLAEAKETVAYLEGLAALTAQRARDLRQMVASSRGT